MTNKQNPKLEPDLLMPVDKHIIDQIKQIPGAAALNWQSSRKRVRVVESSYVQHFGENIAIAIRQANQQLADEARENGNRVKKIHVGTLRTVMDLCVQSIAKEIVINGEKQTVILDEQCDDGTTVPTLFAKHKLKKVGSRVEMTTEQISQHTGIPLWRLREQIPLWKHTGIIVNHGLGALDELNNSRGNSGVWIEFDAMMCWNGNLRHRKWYTEKLYPRPDPESDWWEEFITDTDNTNTNTQLTTEVNSHGM